MKQQITTDKLYNTVDEFPFAERETIPLYFYPFLSTISNKATRESLDAFYKTLDKAPAAQNDILLYIHIPYCKNICHFCGFYRDLSNENSTIIDEYVKKLLMEIECYAGKPYIAESKITSVYFGGGTPSLLSPLQIDSLMTALKKVFNIPAGTELSFEGEVRTLKDKERLKVLRKHNCTRVSFGVQSFHKEVRKYAGLAASMEDVHACMENITAYGYDVNLDLMYGLPGQTYATWLNDIQAAIDHNAVNIDIYDTVLYPQSILFKRRNELKHITVDEIEKIRMINSGINKLLNDGYNHITVEDFSKPGKEYKMKKLVYGGGHGRSEMFALGAGAVGVINGYSYRNLPPTEYHQWSRDEFKVPFQLIYPMGQVDFYKRALVFFPKLLSLEKKDVDTGWFESNRAVIDALTAKGLIRETADKLELTAKGKLWSDSIALDFLRDEREKQKIWKIGF